MTGSQQVSIGQKVDIGAKEPKALFGAKLFQEKWSNFQFWLEIQTEGRNDCSMFKNDFNE